MDAQDKEIYTRLLDVMLRVEAVVEALRPPVELLNVSVTSLTALALRLERQLDGAPPAE